MASLSRPISSVALATLILFAFVVLTPCGAEAQITEIIDATGDGAETRSTAHPVSRWTDGNVYVAGATATTPS